jgi:hypothetical protein
VEGITQNPDRYRKQVRQPNMEDRAVRKEIAWISPLRTGIVYAAIIFVFYFVFSIIMLILGDMGGMESAEFMLGGGFVSIIFGLVMGAVSGFIGGMIGAFIYNIAAGIVGGVVIELKDI